MRPPRSTARPVSPARRLTRARVGLVTAVYLVAFMALLDVTIVIIALPAIESGLGATTAQAQWVVSSYTLCLSTLALSAGALGDRYGRKRVFLLGLGLFTAGSAVCAAAPDPAVLIAGRFVQGAGAAIAVPGTLALLARGFPEPRARARAIGGWGSVAGLAGVVGPVLGGGLVEAVGWRAIFLVNLPLGLVAFIVGRRCIGDSADPGEVDLDVAGQLLAITGLGALAFGLIHAGSHGWASPATLVALPVAALALGAFGIVERRQRAPMLPIRLFADPRFSAATSASASLGVTAFTLLVFLPSYLQQVSGYSAGSTGLVLLPWPVAQMISSAMAGRWSGRHGPRIPMTTGLGVLAAAALALLWIRPDTGYPLLVVVFAAFGAGVGLTFTPSNAAVLAAVAPVRAGTAAATVNAVRQTGTSLGIAALGLLFYGPDPTAGLHQVAIAAAAVATAAAVYAGTTRSLDAPAADDPSTDRGATARTGAAGNLKNTSTGDKEGTTMDALDESVRDAQLATILAPPSTAVLVVDVQNDFIDPTPTAPAMLARLGAFLDSARAAGTPIIWTRAFRSPHMMSEAWRQHFLRHPAQGGICWPGTPGADYHPTCRPADGDIEIAKYHYSAFTGTNLDMVLHSHAVTTVVVTGIDTAVCVSSTARDAFDRDFHTVTLSDCSASRSEQQHSLQLEALDTCYGIVTTSEQVVRIWKPAAADDRGAVPS
jgi:DHA2 family methylenomycin A resistance protein-like MFS transporter